MQCACAILLSVACPALQYFSALSHKRRDFREKKQSYRTQNVCFDFLYKFCLQKFLTVKDHWASYGPNVYIGLHATYRPFLSDFNQTWIFWTGFRKTVKYQISWKSVEWELSFSMRTGGQTRENEQSLFAILRKAPNNQTNLDNYRGITPLNTTLKLFTINLNLWKNSR